MISNTLRSSSPTKGILNTKSLPSNSFRRTPSIRYPGMPIADTEEARAAIEIAQRIVVAVLDDLAV